MDITQKLTQAYAAAEIEKLAELEGRLPIELINRISSWKFGSYGWTSPVNLMITAAWYKWLFPTQDVCKIWAQDHNKMPIPGGFAIRSNDEKYTVPLVTKARIANGFCSPNSGMQGSRAIEKMRSANRIQRNSSIDQRVSFDMALFQNILNDIDDLSSEQSFDFLKWLLRRGIQIRDQREQENKSLINVNVEQYFKLSKVSEFTKNASDPQFVRVVVAHLSKILIKAIYPQLNLEGMEGAKTAADSQSKSPGDFWFANHDNSLIIAFEVKDSSKTIGFDILQAIENRKRNNPEIMHYFAISAADQAVSTEVLKDPFWSKNLSRLRDNINVNVVYLSINELFGLYQFCGGQTSDLISNISYSLAVTKDLKIDTISRWKLEFSL